MSDPKKQPNPADTHDRDEGIIDLLFARSEEGLTLLKEKYGSLCRRIAQNLLGNRQDAEECENDVILAVWNTIPSLTDTHMPQPYLRSVFEQMWREEGEVLDRTCRSRQRSNDGVNCWVVRYEQLMSGRFEPISESDTKLDTLGEERIDDICRYIREKRYAMYCLNDSTAIRDFEAVRDKLLDALQTILPNKCSYER